MTTVATALGAAPQEAQTEEAFDLGEMLIGKVSDHDYIEFGSYHLNLPHWDPIQIGSLSLNLSPTKNTVYMVFAGVLCLLVFLTVARTFRRMSAGDAPGGFANAVEALVVFFRDQVVRANIGHHSDHYTPFILTLFVFILFMNVLGLVPFGASSTASISVTAALAFLVFIWVEVSGMRALGPAGYARTIFYAPPGLNAVGTAVMLVIMTPVELLGKIAKPFALAIRLFANMTAGKVLILALLGLIFVFGDLTLGRWGIAGAAIAMAAAITLLKVFIALLQAFIFAMLTSVFIGLIRHAH